MNISTRFPRFFLVAFIAAACALAVGVAPGSAAACGGYGAELSEDQQAAQDAARLAMSKLAVHASLGAPAVDGDSAKIPVHLRVSRTRWVSRVLMLKRTAGLWHVEGIKRA